MPHIYYGNSPAVSSGWIAIMFCFVHSRYAAARYTGWNHRANGNTVVFRTKLSVFSRQEAITFCCCCCGEKVLSKKRRTNTSGDWKLKSYYSAFLVRSSKPSLIRARSGSLANKELDWSFARLASCVFIWDSDFLRASEAKAWLSEQAEVSTSSILLKVPPETFGSRWMLRAVREGSAAFGSVTLNRESYSLIGSRSRT